MQSLDGRTRRGARTHGDRLKIRVRSLKTREKVACESMWRARTFAVRSQCPNQDQLGAAGLSTPARLSQKKFLGQRVTTSGVALQLTRPRTPPRSGRRASHYSTSVSGSANTVDSDHTHRPSASRHFPGQCRWEYCVDKLATGVFFPKAHAPQRCRGRTPLQLISGPSLNPASGPGADRL